MLPIARNVRMIYLLLLKRAARLLKKAPPDPGYGYLQCNQLSELTRLTGHDSLPRRLHFTSPLSPFVIIGEGAGPVPVSFQANKVMLERRNSEKANKPSW